MLVHDNNLEVECLYCPLIRKDPSSEECSIMPLCNTQTESASAYTSSSKWVTQIVGADCLLRMCLSSMRSFLLVAGSRWARGSSINIILGFVISILANETFC